MSNELMLVKSTDFNGIVLDCYVEPEQQDKGDFWATREQIGTLLEYEYPREAVSKIHQRNKERLDKFSTEVKLTLVESGRKVSRDVVVYNFKGLLEVCRYSNQPNANAVIDKLWEIADEIRRTGGYSVPPKPQVSLKENIEVTRAILEIKHIEDNQLILALDKIYKRYTGFSMLEATGTQLIAPDTNQLLTPTDIGKNFGLSARKVNDLLAGAGYQYKIAGNWEPLELGEPYAVMQDVGKAHSDGTPVRQLKWNTGILPVVEQLMEAS